MYSKFDRKYPITNNVEKWLPEDNKFVKVINYLGKHSFFIYLLHFPVLYGIMFGIKKLGGGVGGEF